MPQTFTISDAELARAKAWAEEHEKVCALSKVAHKAVGGGRYSYTFTITTFGDICSVVCACKESETLTEFFDFRSLRKCRTET